MFNELEEIMYQSLAQNPDIIERKDYRKIYSVFVSSLKDKYQDDYPSVNQFLESELSRFDIVKSCIKYIDNGKPSAESALNKYLNAMTLFYNNYFIPQNLSNENLAQIMPFSGLYDEISQKIKKKLYSKYPYPVLSEQDFTTLIGYMNKFKKLSRVEKEIFLIWRLMLLYGFKLERINSLEIGHFDHSTRSLSVIGFDNDTIILELPTKLSEDLYDYIESIKPRHEGYIFLTPKNETIQPAFFSYHFNNLKKICKQTTKLSSFSTTGLAKYAICRMLEAEIDTYFIQRITGMDVDIIQYCQEEVFKAASNCFIENNRKINVKIKSIPTNNTLY